MTEQNPITPPPESLVEQWVAEYWSTRSWRSTQAFCSESNGSTAGCQRYILTKTSQWGYEQRGTDLEAKLQKARDEELEACCKAIADQIITVGNIGLSGPTGVLHRETHSSWPAFAQMVSRQLRAAMRPKPPSLAEEALEALDRMDRLPMDQLPTAKESTRTSRLVELKNYKEDHGRIRRALERLQELEGQGDGGVR